jgi:transposase
MSHWAAAPLDRQQATLFAPTLDDTIVADHPVRLFDEVLGEIDFSDWQSMYIQVVGQPPIHPRVMAAEILYGLSLGIRSSRKLEDACGNRLDLIWLLEGRKPDHATFCKFRTQFGPQLKSLFRKVGKVAIALGRATLNQITLDGTDIRANNSRFNTSRRASLEQKLAALDQQIEAALTQARQQDQAEDQLYGEESSPTQLPKDLRDLKRRQEKLKAAMDKLQQMEQERGGRSDLSAKGPAVPLADADSRVLPNKSGGYAPNYTAVLAVDGDSGMILDRQVLGGNDEASTVLPAVTNIQESFAARPAVVLADSGFNTGPNLQALQEAGVEALMPARQELNPGPADRPDPTQAVAEDQRQALPINPQSKVLDKAAFVYVESRDQYLCPMGRTLDYVEDKGYDRHGRKGTYRVYECGSCADCPLASRCLPGKSAVRRVCRDEFEELREKMAARMNGERGRRQYRCRAHVAETPHAAIKTRMNFRQFLLRGREKVEQEFHWLATAYNLTKLIRLKSASALRGMTTVGVK